MGLLLISKHNNIDNGPASHIYLYITTYTMGLLLISIHNNIGNGPASYI